MAIQEVINQGITTAAVIGNLSGIPEMRRAGKYQKAILEGAHRITPEGEGAFDQQEFKQIRPAVNTYLENQLELFKKTGKSKYLKEFQETAESMKQFEPTLQRSDKERILRQRQRDNVKARRDGFTASIGGQQIKDPELLKKLKEASKNGK